MNYRKATIKDLNEICQLRKQLETDPEDKLTTEYAPYSEKRDRPFIEKCLKARKRIILVAEEDNKIVAHSIIMIEEISKKMQPYYTYQKKALLVHLYVDKNKRRQGIGAGLTQFCLGYLKKQGIDFMDLECYTYNKKASALYNKLGFSDVFITKRFNLLKK